MAEKYINHYDTARSDKDRFFYGTIWERHSFLQMLDIDQVYYLTQVNLQPFQINDLCKRS